MADLVEQAEATPVEETDTDAGLRTEIRNLKRIVTKLEKEKQELMDNLTEATANHAVHVERINEISLTQQSTIAVMHNALQNTLDVAKLAMNSTLPRR